MTKDDKTAETTDDTEATNFFDEAQEELKKEAAEEAQYEDLETWNQPDELSPGAALRGIFMKAVPQATKYGTGYRVIVKDVDTDVYVEVWAKGTVIRDGILNASPAKGSPIVFLYNGMRTSGSGNDYPHYSVRSEKADPEYWAKVTAEGARKQLERDNRVEAPPEDDSPDEAPY